MQQVNARAPACACPPWTAAPPPTRLTSRAFGRTRRVVSTLGLGLAGLGRPAYMSLDRRERLGADRSVTAMRRRCHVLLDAAYAAGITYVDAARSYGLAEAFVRSWCDARQIAEGALTVGSKWGYIYTGGWQMAPVHHEVKRLTLDTLQWQAAESRAILGRRLSLYQIHSATLASGVLDNAAVLSELSCLRAHGLSIGITVTGPEQAATIRRALDVRIDGTPLFDTIQATWNLLEPSAGAALADAHAAGRAVIVKEVLANGRLTDRHAEPALRRLAAHARARGTSIATLAIAQAIRQPWATVVLSGAVTPDQLNEHLSAFDFLDDPVPAVATEPPASYWQARSAILWQ